MPKVKAQTANQKHIDSIAWRCIKFIDSNPPGSKILDNGGTPFSSWLIMTYRNKNLFIEFRVQNSPYSNGNSYVLVKVGVKKVFEAKGNFIVMTSGVKANVYVPGKWEQRIPKITE